MTISYKIYSFIFIVFTWSRSNIAQLTDICATYNAAKFSSPASVEHDGTVSTIKNTLGPLCNLQEWIRNHTENVDEVVVIIGRTGTGKSTLVQSLSGIKEKEAVKLHPPPTIPDLADPKTHIRSDTLVPERFYANKTNTLYLDCAGFEDTRGPKFDIWASHFNRLMLNKEHRVKLIMVEVHRNLDRGGERHAWATLLHHVATLVKDVGRFPDSIGFVASLVASDTKTDEEIVKGIEELIVKTRPNFATSSDEMKIIDAVLAKPAGASRIGITRLMKDPKDTAEWYTEKMNQTRVYLQKMVNERLKYQTTEVRSFGYTVSASTKLFIQELLDGISKVVNSNIAAVIQAVGDHFRPLAGSNETAKALASAYTYLLDVKEELENSDDLDLFLDRWLPDMPDMLNVTFNEELVYEILEYKDYITFFRDVSSNTVASKMLFKGFATAELKSLDKIRQQKCESNSSNAKLGGNYNYLILFCFLLISFIHLSRDPL